MKSSTEYISYVNQGSQPGHDVQHWLEAEQELPRERNLTPSDIKRNPDPWIQQFLNASLKRFKIPREDLQPHAALKNAKLPSMIL